MFGSFGMMELILILVIVLIIFGAGRLPQLGEGLGKAIKGFKKSVHDADAIEALGESSPEQGPQASATAPQPDTQTAAPPPPSDRPPEPEKPPRDRQPSGPA